MIWRSPKISHTVSIQMGQSPPSEYYNSDGIGLPFFQGKADFTERIPRVRKWCSQPIRIAREGDILLSVRAPVGPTNIAPSECCIGRGLAGLRAIDSLMLQQYLWYYMKYAEPTLSSKGQGGIFSAVSRCDIGSLSIPLPPLSEQRKIVDILEQADAIRNIRAEADEKMHRVLTALFYKMFGDITTNNKGWEIRLLGDPRVCRINPRFRRGYITDDVKVSFIPMAEVDEVWGRIKGQQIKNYSEVSKGYTFIGENDVIFAKITPCMQNGKAAIAKGLCEGMGFGSTEFHVLRSSELSTPEWLYGLVRLSAFRKMAETSFTGSAGQQRVPADFLEKFIVPVPPMDKQVSFAHALRRFELYRDKAVDSSAKVEKLFDILLHRAFSGELTAKWREAHMKELLQEMEVQARELGFQDPGEEDRPIRVTDFPNPLLEKKAILLAYIILRSLEAKHQIARVKLAKQYYFVNQFIQQPLTEHFQPMAAGPLDNDIFAALELAQFHKWVVIEPQKGNEKPLSAGVCIADTEDLALDILGLAKTQVDDYLESTKDWGWETLERWSTIHAVALKLIKGNTPINVESIKTYIRSVPEWKAKLSRDEFSDENIDKTIVGLKLWDLLPNN